jgi:hypothetical protein
MAADAQAWPEFDSPLLGAIAAAFCRRRRAIRYHGPLACTRELSETPQGTFERLNMDHGDRAQLRLSVWADGAMWLRACAPRPGRNAGWAFLCCFDGEVSGIAADEIVRLFEASLLVCTVPGDAVTERLRELWQAVHPSDSVE